MNRIKEMIANKEVPLGFFIGIHSPAIVEMAGYTGFDYIVIDNEHGVFTWNQIEELIRAAELVHLVPIVRVSCLMDIGKALDMGAKGIHVPQVNSKEEAEQVMNAVRFPPHGRRGAAYSVRAAQYGQRTGADYLTQSNDNIVVVVHIETPEAVQHIDGIIETGIDIAFIGPTDLSVSAGYADQPEHPELLEMMDHVRERCFANKIPLGIMVGGAETMLKKQKWGAQYISFTLTSILRSAMKTVTSKREV